MAIFEGLSDSDRCDFANFLRAARLLYKFDQSNLANNDYEDGRLLYAVENGIEEYLLLMDSVFYIEIDEHIKKCSICEKLIAESKPLDTARYIENHWEDFKKFALEKIAEDRKLNDLLGPTNPRDHLIDMCQNHLEYFNQYTKMLNIFLQHLEETIDV
jgi:hypothetical protein